MITKFADVFAELKEKGVCKRLVAAWAVDEHTIVACAKASELGFVKVTLVGDKELIRETCQKNNIDIELFEIVNEPVELKAVSKAVQLVHDGEGDVLMKGLCSTDKFLRAILNKETGLLPQKGVLSHVGVIESPNYHKLLFLSDMAVIPLPDFRQKVKIAGYLVGVAKSFGISKPKLAFIAASEQVLDSMPACMEAAALARMVEVRKRNHGHVSPRWLTADRSRAVSLTALWLWMSRSTRSLWRSRNLSARLPVTLTVLSSLTSSPPMCSGRQTPNSPLV